MPDDLRVNGWLLIPGSELHEPDCDRSLMPEIGREADDLEAADARETQLADIQPFAASGRAIVDGDD